MKSDTRWKISVWSRFVGILITMIFSMFTIYAKDIWSHALLQLALVILIAVFIIIIPDRIVFGEYLIDRVSHKAKNVRVEDD